MIRFTRVTRLAQVRLLCVILCYTLIISSVPSTTRVGVSHGQGNPPQQGGLRTTEAPSKNLPDLDTSRNQKEAEPKAPAQLPAKRCRWFDSKCKQNKEKKAENNIAPNSGNLRNGLIASAAKLRDPFAWRGDTLADRWLSLPLEGISALPEKPVYDLPDGAHGSSEPSSAALQYIYYNDIMTARADLKYRTGTGGEDLFSGNYNWSLPILGFPGRSGHDVALTLSYNSTTYVRVGNTVVFDPDFSPISPGFRLGLPIFAGPYTNTQSNKNCYQLILPSGRVVEMRQVSGTTYESGDSTYARMTQDATGYFLRTADGTQYKYQSLDQCIEIKDRNGNLITISYTDFGSINTITDTLGRVFQFNYGSFNELQSIYLAGAFTSRLIANFGYVDNTLLTDFRDQGTPLTQYNFNDGLTYPVLSQVFVAKTNSTYTFEHSSYGQVYQIRNVPAGLERSKVVYNLPLMAVGFPAQSDCPRFTQRTDTAYEWNTTGVNTLFQIAPLSTAAGADICGQVTATDGTVYKEIAWSVGWQRGLVKETQSLTGATLQKKTTTTWDQDTYTTYQNNPRAIESKVIDVANSNKTRRTVIGYVSYNLPSDVYEYDYDQTTLLRRSHTDYNLATTYISRRIIGLPSAQMLYDGSNNLASKVTSSYDDTGFMQNLSPAPINHDGANYGSTFQLGRGNLTKVARYDVNNSTFAESQVGYYITGSPAFTRDPLNHQTNIFYTDSFSNLSNATYTYAYPTQIQDPDGYWSYLQYHYQWGEVTRTTNPKGASVRHDYTAYGLPYLVTNEVNGAYTRYEFALNQYYVKTYTTIQEGQGEFYSITVFDGHGRPRATVSDHPGSAGQYKGVYNGYDTMGRLSQQSNPTEINSAWNPYGDDVVNGSNGGWRYSLQTYDWKGRPLISTNTDGTTKAADYIGCGCAGGDTTTLTDEGTVVTNPTTGQPEAKKRQQKVTRDALGRVTNTQILNWQNGTPYSTTINTYNVRDQITNVKEYSGPATGSEACPSATCQITSASYDGYGRLQSRKSPIESSPTTYSYFADDTTQTKTDPRGVAATYSYNNRKLATGIDYAEIPNLPTADVTFGYDETGKRLWMNDGPGRVDYSYDSLNRLNYEERVIDGVGTYRTNYTYNLTGQLKTLTDRYGEVINYIRDKAGRLSSVTGNGFGGDVSFASQFKYRAWNALKSLAYGNGNTLALNYTVRLLPSSYKVPGILDKTYQYASDGQMKFSDDLMDTRYDRSAEYDHAGRLSKALTGMEASGGTLSDGPYHQAYAYDVWGHTLSRTAFHWDQNLSVTANYSNDRRQGQGVGYDAAGHIINDGRTYVYDSAGRLASVGVDAYYTYDGDGQLLKSDAPSNPPYTTYYLRSSALGNQVISEIVSSSTTPNNRRDFIYADGPLLARQAIHRTINGNDARDIVLEHRDAMGTSARTSVLVGLGGGPNTELDPLGADMGLNNPYVNQPYTPPDETDPTFPNFGNPSRFLGQGCSYNGFPVDCPWLMDRINNTAGGGASYRVDESSVWVNAGSFTVSSPNGDDKDGTVRIGSAVTYPLGYWKLGTTVSFTGYSGAGFGLTGGQQREAQNSQQNQKTPCGEPPWDQAIGSNGIFNQVLNPIGIRHDWIQGQHVHTLTEEATLDAIWVRLVRNGWEAFFTDPLPEHWGYVDFRKQYKEEWYHLSLKRPGGPAVRWGRPMNAGDPINLTLHWEEAQPGSLGHGWNWVSAHIILPVVVGGVPPMKEFRVCPPQKVEKQ